MCISRLAIYQRRYAKVAQGVGKLSAWGALSQSYRMPWVHSDQRHWLRENCPGASLASECLSQPEMGLRPFALSTLGQADLADTRYADAPEHLLDSLAIRREWGNPAWIA